MLIVTYDISDDKTRTKFSKFLEKFGRRLQMSVFEISNSERILRLIVCEIENVFSKKIVMTDSVLIFPVCKTCDAKVLRYGRPVQEESDLVMV